MSNNLRDRIENLIQVFGGGHVRVELERQLDGAAPSFNKSLDASIRRLAEVAAPHCGGGEDLIGALIYTGFSEEDAVRIARGSSVPVKENP
jgi:hypothetical protein